MRSWRRVNACARRSLRREAVLAVPSDSIQIFTVEQRFLCLRWLSFLVLSVYVYVYVYVYLYVYVTRQHVCVDTRRHTYKHVRKE